jgi:hypothetical protein
MADADTAELQSMYNALVEKTYVGFREHAFEYLDFFIPDRNKARYVKQVNDALNKTYDLFFETVALTSLGQSASFPRVACSEMVREYVLVLLRVIGVDKPVQLSVDIWHKDFVYPPWLRQAFDKGWTPIRG